MFRALVMIALGRKRLLAMMPYSMNQELGLAAIHLCCEEYALEYDRIMEIEMEEIILGP